MRITSNERQTTLHGEFQTSQGLPLKTLSQKSKTEQGHPDYSADKGVCNQALRPEFNLWVPHGGRRESIPTSCPLSYVYTKACSCMWVCVYTQ